MRVALLAAAAAALLFSAGAALAWPGLGHYAGTGGGTACTPGALNFTLACDTVWAL